MKDTTREQFNLDFVQVGCFSSFLKLGFSLPSSGLSLMLLLPQVRKLGLFGHQWELR
jgi:hypothetical protein